MPYSKERYQRYKAEHRCVNCGREAFANFTRCANCMEQAYLSSNKNPEHRNQLERERRAKKKELGICWMCSQPVGEKSTLYCDKHYLWKLRYQARRRNS